MEEPQQPIIHPIKRAANKHRYLRRSKKAVTCNPPDDSDIVLCQSKGGRLRRAPKPRSACTCLGQCSVHAVYMAAMKRIINARRKAYTIFELSA